MGLLVTQDRLRIMASLTPAVPIPSPPPVPSQATDDELWAVLNQTFDSKWTERFPNEPLAGEGRLLVRTDFVANLINQGWNSANPTISARDSLPSKTEVPFIPET